jgi:hypothetical protein
MSQLVLKKVERVPGSAPEPDYWRVAYASHWSLRTSFRNTKLANLWSDKAATQVIRHRNFGCPRTVPGYSDQNHRGNLMEVSFPNSLYLGFHQASS